jgi:hypothetical protein
MQGLLRFLAGAFFVFTALAVQAGSVTLSRITRLPDGSAEMVVSGSASSPLVLQGTSDFKTWKDIQTFNLSGTPVTLKDPSASSQARRLYRVNASTQAIPLPDLSGLQNRVFPAPEGADTIQFAPNGTLGYIVWRDQQLIYRERNASGAWSEQVVNSQGATFKPYLVFDFSAPREDYRFQPSAVLLFDGNSRAHIFQANGRGIDHYTQADGGQFSKTENINNPQADGSIDVLEGSVGPGNIFHFVALSSGSPRKLSYGSNSGGNWNWNFISTVGDPPLTYWAPPFAARWLGLAVDSNNRAHIVYRASLDLTYDSAGHPRAYSELKYASNASGSWNSVVVQRPRDLSGEAANGASIAIGSNNKPAIVSWYDERADTGSAEESRSYYHTLDGNGNWQSSVIATAPDGYVAGDGPKGTGFSPRLKFDDQGRAHVVFMDHAGEHFGGIGQQEYAGNLRHGWWNGSGWSFETLFRQSAPLQGELVYPAFALRGSELAVTFLERQTAWKYSSFPPLSASKYYFHFQTGSAH